MVVTLRGRATGWRIPGRFDSEERIAEPPDDSVLAQGGGQDDGPGAGPAAVPTRVRIETMRSIVVRNRSADVYFEQSVNPYRGCEHGCIYCYARTHHAFVGLSPGLDFEQQLFARPDAVVRLREAWARRNYRCMPITVGTVTDPYQPIEGTWRITRQILELALEHQHPLNIITRSHRIERDLDLLTALARLQLVSVCISLTTLDAPLARRMEPRAPTPQRRVQAIRCLADAGIPVAVSLAPLIPFLTDGDIEARVAAAAQAGAVHVFATPVRLPHEVAPLFIDWLQTHFPDRADRILKQIAGMHGGQWDDPRPGHRMRGSGAYADLLRQRVALAVRRAGLQSRMADLAVDRFRVPPASDGQRSLF